jgi:hypothetical protein
VSQNGYPTILSTIFTKPFICFLQDGVPFCCPRAVARVSRGRRLNEKPGKVVTLAVILATL